MLKIFKEKLSYIIHYTLSHKTPERKKRKTKKELSKKDMNWCDEAQKRAQKKI